MSLDAIVEAVGVTPYWAVCGIIPLWILKDFACRSGRYPADTVLGNGGRMFLGGCRGQRGATSKALNTLPSGPGGALLTMPGREIG